MTNPPLLALDQPRILQGRHQKPRRVDTLAPEQGPQPDGRQRVAVVAYPEDVGPGHPLRGEDAPGIVGHHAEVGAIGFIGADLVVQHPGIREAGAGAREEYLYGYIGGGLGCGGGDGFGDGSERGLGLYGGGLGLGSGRGDF